VKRNGHVVLCATTPIDDCGDARHWHEGWVMFADADGNATIDPADAILGHDGSAEAGVTLVGNGPVERYLRFDYSGRARTISGALQMGTIEVCRTGLRGYRVVLANSGRTRIERSPLTCS
jgi:type IV fimbrial biogenesis protein FimT